MSIAKRKLPAKKPVRLERPQTLLEKWYEAAYHVYCAIAPDLYEGLEALGLAEPDQEGIAELCIDADRMDPAWSGACYQGLSQEDYAAIVAMWRTPEGRAQMVAVVNFSR